MRPKRKSSMTCRPIAINKPILLAFDWSFSESLLAIMEIKIILSIPRMISIKVRVSRATQA
jgi:hypothetical protein